MFATLSKSISCTVHFSIFEKRKKTFQTVRAQYNSFSAKYQVPDSLTLLYKTLCAKKLKKYRRLNFLIDFNLILGDASQNLSHTVIQDHVESSQQQPLLYYSLLLTAVAFSN